MIPPETPRANSPADEPVFETPWQAEAFALAVLLNERGVFGWDEWTRTLAHEIHRPNGEAKTYYQHWLAALERLATEKRLIGREEMAARRDAWDRATRATPHGQPILLENDPLARGGAAS